MALKFETKSIKKIKRIPRKFERESKYQELIDAVNSLEQGQCIEIPCPESVDLEKFYQSMASLRRKIKDDRELYVKIVKTVIVDEDGDETNGVAFAYGEEKRKKRVRKTEEASDEAEEDEGDEEELEGDEEEGDEDEYEEEYDEDEDEED